MRAYLFLVMLLIASSACAHDLITAEAAERYLGTAAQWHAQSTSAPVASERAEAHVRIGAMLDEIRELLNRDLAIHGKVQGLASNYLVAELSQLGTPLAYSDSRQIFLANSAHYRAALEIGFTGPLEREAKLRLLRGEFYDSFDYDPLQSAQTWNQLQEQATIAEDLASNTVDEPDREEVRFIAALAYARAAKFAPDAKTAAGFRSKATASAIAFERDYPDSMRSAAMPVVRDAMQALN
jgi:hypothetical protein